MAGTWAARSRRCRRAPSRGPRTADWTLGEGYKEVGFAPSGPVYATYAWGHHPANDGGMFGGSPCGFTEADLANPVVNVIWGALDLDGDGLYGGFTVQTTLHGEQLVREPGLGTLESGLIAQGVGGCPFCAADFID